jgi:hypothetical protein
MHPPWMFPQLTQSLYELREPYGSKGNAAATIAMTIYNAAQMYIGTEVDVCLLVSTFSHP